MTPEQFAQIVGEGNHARIEEAWMAAMDATEAKPGGLAKYARSLTELCDRGRKELADTLAATGIDGVASRFSPEEAVKDAGPLLLAIGESEALRAAVSDLYRKAFGDREGFEGLLTEAGLPKGRPVRRALRTLDVCLAVDVGTFLVSRDEPGAARIDEIDRSDWRYTITSDDGTEVLGAVHLADRYYPAEENDFTVLKQFDREGLLAKLSDDPAAVLVDLCKERENRIDSDELQDFLVPELMTAAEFKKWWTKARAAIKGVPHLQIEGRSPYVVSFIGTKVTFEDLLEKDLKRTHDTMGKLSLVDQYVKDCAAAGQEPSKEALERCHADFAARAARAAAKNRADAGLLLTIARHVGEMAGVDSASEPLADWLRIGPDLRRAAAEIHDAVLLDLFLSAVVEARPETWQDELLELLPWLPQHGCDGAAVRLVQAGKDPIEFDALVQQCIASPVEHFEALLWLWDGPTNERISSGTPSINFLTRILRALDESRREEVCTRQQAKQMAIRARSVLAARRMERFVKCLEGIERGMASALRTQINQLDVLGRAVKEDMLGLILDHFPVYDIKRKLAPWEREDVLFVTEYGMSRKQSEIEQHVNVKMKENAKAIGAAAEKGDLSENSEYKFALEERDLLRARLMQMNAEMGIARVIQPNEVPTDVIGVGTRAVFEAVDGGERYELAFLGPWDADPEKGWLNYKSPLGQRMMGKRAGDVVEFDHGGRTGEYRIVELRNALLEDVAQEV